MTLAFSTKFPKGKSILSGDPTYFVEQIWNALDYVILASLVGNSKATEASHDFFYAEDGQESLMFRKYPGYSGTMGKGKKIHSIRQDSKNRWKVGMKIHFVINNRTRNRFQFAPVLECTGIENISIKWHHTDKGKHVYFDLEGHNIACCIWNKGHEDRPILTCHKAFKEIVSNDGFFSFKEFFAWFDQDFTGKIIHWTHKKYFVEDMNTYKIQ